MNIKNITKKQKMIAIIVAVALVVSSVLGVVLYKTVIRPLGWQYNIAISNIKAELVDEVDQGEGFGGLKLTMHVKNRGKMNIIKMDMKFSLYLYNKRTSEYEYGTGTFINRNNIEIVAGEKKQTFIIMPYRKNNSLIDINDLRLSFESAFITWR